MKTKLTSKEELAVTKAISYRIRSLSATIEQSRSLGLDTHVLLENLKSLLDAYSKISGKDYKF